MTSLRDRTDHPDGPAVDESVLGDWLGLAGFLAVAVGNQDVSARTAEAALAESATGIGERQALVRAAEVAATRFGEESLTVQLLQAAARLELASSTPRTS